MKKVTLMALAILFSVMTVFATYATTGSTGIIQTKSQIKKVKHAKVQYTCTMHHDVLSDKPGKCPKCGMKLVRKKS